MAGTSSTSSAPATSSYSRSFDAPLCPEIEETALSLLRRCSFESDHPFFVQVGLKGEDVFVLAARMERSQVYRMVDAFEFIRTLYADTGL